MLGELALERPSAGEVDFAGPERNRDRGRVDRDRAGTRADQDIGAGLGLELRRDRAPGIRDVVREARDLRGSIPSGTATSIASA